MRKLRLKRLLKVTQSINDGAGTGTKSGRLWVLGFWAVLWVLDQHRTPLVQLLCAVPWGEPRARQMWSSPAQTLAISNLA